MEKTGVYILVCNNNRYYTGSTNDFERRFDQHCNGWVKATKYLRPLELKIFIPCQTLEEARKLEYKIKKQKSRKYIEELIILSRK